MTATPVFSPRCPTRQRIPPPITTAMNRAETISHADFPVQDPGKIRVIAGVAKAID